MNIRDADASSGLASITRKLFSLDSDVVQGGGVLYA